MKTQLIEICPVLPSQDIIRDVAWYQQYMGFEVRHQDDMYAVMRRENICFHLQWHADTEDDPLLGGSVMRIFVQNINGIFEEYIQRGTITKDKLRLNTPWLTNEFGFYDLNKNAIFIFENC